MTDKELLLKDLCTRLPYHLKGKSKDGKLYEATIIYDTGTILATEVNGVNTNICCGFKPYLRPMSSMTEDEKQWFNALRNALTYQENGEYDLDDFNELQDFLNRRHLDYRGLIPMGLALEAPEEMYD